MTNRDATAAVNGPDLAPVARLTEIALWYGKVRALDRISLDFPASRMVGLIGPDGVGKSSLLALVAGARRVQKGQIEVLGGDMRDAAHRQRACPRIAYMPQGLGKNLYPTLSVFENVDFFGRLFGHDRAERARRIAELLESTGLAPFASRPVGKLSGGMKQKLGLCCALIHDPDLLILDEPTTGVDPLSRRQFWELIDRIQSARPGMSVLVATAYMGEAARFDWLVAMDGGRVLATGTPAELLERTKTASLEEAFVALLPEEGRRGHRAVEIRPRAADDGQIAIEARDLTMRFGDFVAVDRVSFRIERGEIFGFLGSNGCGKTTTMKMLTGLLAASEGQAWLLGQKVDAQDLETRRRVGYMSQGFSLYSELTVRQNLVLRARLFEVPKQEVPRRVENMLARFGLEHVVDALPDSLPLGQRQRLSLAVALIHRPELLILDEPTSGVDPVARDGFWEHLVELSRRDRVTIFISTHFVNEAQRCDRISLMHAGRVLVSDAPGALVEKRGVKTLEDAFISYLEEAVEEGWGWERVEPAEQPAVQPSPQPRGRGGLVTEGSGGPGGEVPGEEPRGSLSLWERVRVRAESPAARPAVQPAPEQATHSEAQPSSRPADQPAAPPSPRPSPRGRGGFSVRRMLSYNLREALELSRDPIRATLAVLGSVILMFIMGYGITMDVEDLTFAVLDRDQTTVSRDYLLNLAGSRYFIEQPPIADYAELDRRMRTGEISLAIEIPPGMARDLARGTAVQIGVWIDGAMPQRAETIRGYVQGMHAHWLAEKAAHVLGRRHLTGPATLETRFRYNPDVKSLDSMVPAVIPLLLLLIPAILAALSVVREKELGSIVNLYVTPVKPLEFMLGKQLPYVALGMFNFLLLAVMAVTIFGVPLTGSLAALTAGALLYVGCATALGLLISSFTRSQVAAIFGTAVLTLLPAVEFCGMIDPVSSLQGGGALIGRIFPTTYFLVISRGAFSKALSFYDLFRSFVPLLAALVVLTGSSVALLKKQES